MIAQDSVLKAIATFNFASGTKAQNVYHLAHDSDGTADDEDMVADVAEAIRNLMSNLATNVSDEVTLEKVEVYERISGAWQPVGVDTTSWAGTNAGDRIPAGAALMINLFKSRSGYADRKYIAGMSEGSVTGDTYGSGTLSNAAAFVADALLGFLGTQGNTVQFVHYNRSTEEVAPYVSGAGAPTVAYQRRRKPGVGLT